MEGVKGILIAVFECQKHVNGSGPRAIYIRFVLYGDPFSSKLPIVFWLYLSHSGEYGVNGKRRDTERVKIDSNGIDRSVNESWGAE